MGDFLNVLKTFFKVKAKIIRQLESEHKELLNIYTCAYKAFEKQDFSKVLELLNLLYLKYRKHVIYEEYYFYLKLTAKYKDYESIMVGIEDTKKDLKSITKKFEKFISLYSSEDMIKAKFNEFSHDLIHLGEALKERIEFEEKKLYILY